MKVLLFLSVVPAIISTFGLLMAGRRAKEILVERYGDDVEKHISSSNIDTVMSLMKFAMIALCPIINLPLAYGGIFLYEKVRDKVVEGFSAKIEAKMAQEAEQ